MIFDRQPFISWRPRSSFLIKTGYFVLGFLVAWIMCAATFRYVFDMIFSV